MAGGDHHRGRIGDQDRARIDVCTVQLVYEFDPVGNVLMSEIPAGSDEIDTQPHALTESPWSERRDRSSTRTEGAIPMQRPPPHRDPLPATAVGFDGEAGALATGADIVVVPKVAIINRGFAAILRWWLRRPACSRWRLG